MITIVTNSRMSCNRMSFKYNLSYVESSSHHILFTQACEACGNRICRWFVSRLRAQSWYVISLERERDNQQSFDITNLRSKEMVNERFECRQAQMMSTNCSAEDQRKMRAVLWIESSTTNWLKVVTRMMKATQTLKINYQQRLVYYRSEKRFTYKASRENILVDVIFCMTFIFYFRSWVESNIKPYRLSVNRRLRFNQKRQFDANNFCQRHLCSRDKRSICSQK